MKHEPRRPLFMSFAILGHNHTFAVEISLTTNLRSLGRNRLQEESAMLPLKNMPNILELAWRRFQRLFPLQSYCGLHTRKAETSCLRKFLSEFRLRSAESKQVWPLLSLLPQMTSRPLPVSCTCLTMTWAMVVRCSAPAKPQRTQREGVTARWLFLCPCGTG